MIIILNLKKKHLSHVKIHQLCYLDSQHGFALNLLGDSRQPSDTLTTTTPSPLTFQDLPLKVIKNIKDTVSVIVVSKSVLLYNCDYH